jgi:hypothetical protein
MALQLKVKYAISSDRKKLIVVDDTDAYAPNNETGWGTPNLNRNEIGVFCHVTYQAYDKPLQDLTTTQALTSTFLFDSTYTNSEKSTFEFNYVGDGWYMISLYAMTQEEYNSIDFDNLDQFLATGDFPQVYLEDIAMVNLIRHKNKLSEEYFKCLQCDDCNCEQPKENVLKLSILIQATDYRFHSGKQFEAQRMVETLLKQFKC